MTAWKFILLCIIYIKNLSMHVHQIVSYDFCYLIIKLFSFVLILIKGDEDYGLQFVKYFILVLFIIIYTLLCTDNA